MQTGADDFFRLLRHTEPPAVFPSVYFVSKENNILFYSSFPAERNLLYPRPKVNFVHHGFEGGKQVYGRVHEKSNKFNIGYRARPLVVPP